MKTGSLNQTSGHMDHSVFSKNLPIEFSKRKADTSVGGMRKRNMLLSKNPTSFGAFHERHRKFNSILY